MKTKWLTEILVACMLLLAPALVVLAQQPTELLQNGGFEQQKSLSPWVFESTKGGVSVAKNQPYDGSYYVLLGGTNSETDSIEQSVIIPSGALSCDLTFALRIKATGNDKTPHDFLKVRLEGTDGDWHDLLQYSNADGRDWTVTGPVSLMDYVGQLVTLRFEATTDGTKPTKFSIDDVSMKYVPGSSVTPNLEFYSPTRGCFQTVPLDGLTVTGAAPLSLIASAPNGVQSLTAAIDDQQIASTTDTRLDVLINWSTLTPGEHTMTGTITDTTGIIFRKQCTISSTNILQGADFEDNDFFAWDQESTGGAALIQDVGTDGAFDGTGVAILGGLSQSTDMLQQFVSFPDDTQDSLTLSFYYETPAALLSQKVTESLSIQFVDQGTGQAYPVATVNPTQAGWTLYRVPISMADLGLCPGNAYILQFEAIGPNGNSTIPFYLDDVALYVYSATLASGYQAAPPDTLPDPEEGPATSGHLKPIVNNTSLHYGKKEGGDILTINGLNFDPADVKAKFRVGPPPTGTTGGGNWAEGKSCTRQGCTSNLHSTDGMGAIAGATTTQVFMGPITGCSNCGTPHSNLGYGGACVSVINKISGVGGHLSWSQSNFQGFYYGFNPPAVTSISPSADPISGGASVIIYGQNLYYPSSIPSNSSQAVQATVGDTMPVAGVHPCLSPPPCANCSNVSWGYCTSVTGALSTLGWKADDTGCNATSLPGHTGTPSLVTVWNPDGQQATLPNYFSYQRLDPTISSSFPNPSSGSSKGGYWVAITGTNLMRIKSYSFGSYVPTCATGIKLVSGSGSPTAVSLWAPPGCPGGTLSTPLPIAITVNTIDGGTAASSPKFTYIPTQPGPGIFAASNIFTCSSTGYNLVLQFGKGTASPCDDIGTVVATITMGGNPTSDLVVGTPILIDNTVSKSTVAKVTIPLINKKCPPCGVSAKWYYNANVTVTTNWSLSNSLANTQFEIDGLVTCPPPGD